MKLKFCNIRGLLGAKKAEESTRKERIPYYYLHLECSLARQSYEAIDVDGKKNISVRCIMQVQKMDSTYTAVESFDVNEADVFIYFSETYAATSSKQGVAYTLLGSGQKLERLFSDEKSPAPKPKPLVIYLDFPISSYSLMDLSKPQIITLGGGSFYSKENSNVMNASATQLLSGEIAMRFEHVVFSAFNPSEERDSGKIRITHENVIKRNYDGKLDS